MTTTTGLHSCQAKLDSFADWVQELYGKYSDVKVVCRGKEHPYLGAKLIFTDDKAVLVDMRKYLQAMFEEFPEKLTGNVKTLANENLFHHDSRDH